MPVSCETIKSIVNSICALKYMLLFVPLLVEEFGSVWIGDKVGLRYAVFVSFSDPQASVALWLGRCPVSVSVAASVRLVGGQAGLLSQ